LQQVIGGKTQNLNPQFGEFILNKSDRFLICSDGLTNGLFDSAIAKNLAQGDAFSIKREERMAKALVEQSVAEDGKDNTTALCFQVSED
jgi:protein phosphatase